MVHKTSSIRAAARFGRGLAALAYTGITEAGSGFFFGGTGYGWWSGEWWWILLTALGGLAVALLRKIWKVPDEVPGSIALANQAWVEPATACYWLMISIVSLVAGASLGPSYISWNSHRPGDGPHHAVTD